MYYVLSVSSLYVYFVSFCKIAFISIHVLTPHFILNTRMHFIKREALYQLLSSYYSYVIASLFDPTEMCETEKEMFYTKFDFVLDQCPLCDGFIIMGDFNAVIGTG